MIELEKAQGIVNERMPYLGTERVDLLQAHERVLAEDIYSSINQPPFNRSPLDGYAFKAEDSQGASKNNPVSLQVIEEIHAGSCAKKEVEKGTAIRIMTGAPIPEGADCVIRQEDTSQEGNTVQIFTELSQWDNYCFMGEDFKKGDLMLKKNSFLKSAEIGVLASLGVNEISVYKKPRVAILSTGDELLDVKEELIPGKIYNSNLYTIATRVKEFSGEPVILGIAGDDRESIEKNIKAGLDKADFLITTGGVSVGKKDIVKEVLQGMGAEILFWKINIKPGTPALCSVLDKKLIISLSGNPAAATITFELLVRPLLAKITRREDLELKKITAVFKDSFSKKSSRRRFLRGLLSETPQGRIVELTRGKQTPGVLSSILNSNCLIDLPGGSPPLKAGEPVEVIPL